MTRLQHAETKVASLSAENAALKEQLRSSQNKLPIANNKQQSSPKGNQCYTSLAQHNTRPESETSKHRSRTAIARNFIEIGWIREDDTHDLDTTIEMTQCIPKRE
jgi:hypothetical protein